MALDRRLTRIFYTGDRSLAEAHVHDGYMVLDKVREYIRLSTAKIDQYRVDRTLADGTTITALSVFGHEQIFINTPEVTTAPVIPTIPKELTGFLFHPRNGAISILDGKYAVAGSGWDYSGNALSGSRVYPLIDNDHGTKNIYLNSYGDWIYLTRPLGENYGNVDWKGINTTAKKVVTWRGPGSRYRHSSPLYAKDHDSGLYGPIYSKYIYGNGGVIGEIPNDADSLAPYVLGAGLCVDSNGSTWKVCVVLFSDVTSSYYDYTHGIDVHFTTRVLAQKQGYTYAEWYPANPNGWRILATSATMFSSADLPNVQCSIQPFFFNGSGTAASSVSETVLGEVSLDIDALTASIAFTYQPQMSISWTKDSAAPVSQWTPPSGYPATYEATRGPITGAESWSCSGVVAVDYIGDTKVTLDGVLTHSESSYYYEEYTAEYSDMTHFTYTGSRVGTNVKTTTTTYSGDISANPVIESESFSNYFTQSGDQDGGTSSTAITYSDTLNVNAVEFIDLRNNIIAQYKMYTLTEWGGDSEYDLSGSRTYSYAIDVDGEAHFSKEYDPVVTPITSIPGSLASALALTYGGVLPNGTSEVHISGSTTDRLDISSWITESDSLGSYAVASDGTHFYSRILEDQVYNYLTGGVPETIITIPAGDNPVYFPIAPV